MMFSHHGFRWAAIYGAVVGARQRHRHAGDCRYADDIAILPENAREWREVFEYAASIMLAYVTGNVLAALVQRMVPSTLDASSAPSPAVLQCRPDRRRARQQPNAAPTGAKGHRQSRHDRNGVRRARHGRRFDLLRTSRAVGCRVGP